MTILLSGSGQKFVFSFSGSGTGSTRKNPGFRMVGFKLEKLDGGWNDEASVRAPFDSLEFHRQEWISGFFEVSVEASASPRVGSHESSEQGLRSSIHEQERDEIECRQEWISGFFEVSVEAPASLRGGSHESSEQGLRSNIHEQERDEIEFDER
ncbi:hypothetical protein WN943_010615 [Citrus x changshan-huyou]